MLQWVYILIFSCFFLVKLSLTFWFICSCVSNVLKLAKSSKSDYQNVSGSAKKLVLLCFFLLYFNRKSCGRKGFFKLFSYCKIEHCPNLSKKKEKIEHCEPFVKKKDRTLWRWVKQRGFETKLCWSQCMWTRTSLDESPSYVDTVYFWYILLIRDYQKHEKFPR